MLIGLDIDGTIMSPDEFISAEVREAITELRQRGHHVVLSTGRPLVATLPVLKELGIDTGWAVCSNGSVTARLSPELENGYEVHHAVMFDAADAVEALREYMPDAVIALEKIGVGYYISQPFGSSKLHGEYILVDVQAMSSLTTSRVVVARATHAAREFTKHVTSIGLRDSYYAIANEYWMDLAPEGITKAYGMERLRLELGVSEEHTLAVGDSDNDIEMLQWAHRGVAMGHAEAAVIAAADEITYPIIDDGVARVLNGLLGHVAAD